MKFDWKTLLSFDVHYGKKIVTLLYYVMIVLISVNTLCSFIRGILNVCGGEVFNGLCGILFCLPLTVVYLLVLRLVCEMLDLFFDRFDR